MKRAELGGRWLVWSLWLNCLEQHVKSERRSRQGCIMQGLTEHNKELCLQLPTTAGSSQPSAGK